MPRPTLYNTPEEKAAARRATSKKYYEKHRVQINRRSRRKYKKKLQIVRKDISTAKVSKRCDPLWLMEKAKEQFKKLTHGALYTYLDEIAQYCIANPEEALGFCVLMEDQWNAFMMEVQGVLGEILQVYGCGDIWKKADMVARDIRHVVSLVEEIHMQAISSVDDIADWRSSGIFGYQICAEGAKVVI